MNFFASKSEMASNFKCPPCDPIIDKHLSDEVDSLIYNEMINSTAINPEGLEWFLDPDLRPENLSEYWTSFLMNDKQKERKRKLKQENRMVQAITAKLRHHEPLTEEEVEFYQEKQFCVSNLLPAEVQVDAVDILEDIVKGDYTLEDVHSIREGSAAASMKDPCEKSVMQMFDEIVENQKEKISEALNTTTGQFFANLDGSAKGKLLPSQLKDAVNQAATAIELTFVHQPGEKNEASEAIESFIKATVMNEAEIKLKKTGEMMDANRESEDNEKKAEDAAADDQDETDMRTLGFDITGVDYNITLVPSDDPNVYKPLEIISYIGLTGKTE